MPDIYPPVAPTVNGQLITIEQWLQQPVWVQQVITDLTLERFLTDRIFSPGPAVTGGSVLFDQVLGTELYPLSRDVGAIAPGSEFPIVDTGETAPLVASTVKWGGASILTYEQRDRDRRDVLNRKLTKIRNAIVRKVDTVSLAVLRAAPINQAVASGSWSDSNIPIFKDVAGAKTTVERLDMGYSITDAIISPTTALNMLTNDKLLNQLPREGGNGVPNPIVEGALTGVAGIRNWFVTNRVTDDEVFFLEGQTAGSISDERPLYSRVVDQPWLERYLIMAARLCVPFVTAPKSVVRLSGVA